MFTEVAGTSLAHCDGAGEVSEEAVLRAFRERYGGKIEQLSATARLLFKVSVQDVGHSKARAAPRSQPAVHARTIDRWRRAQVKPLHYVSAPHADALEQMLAFFDAKYGDPSRGHHGAFILPV